MTQLILISLCFALKKASLFFNLSHDNLVVMVCIDHSLIREQLENNFPTDWVALTKKALLKNIQLLLI